MLKWSRLAAVGVLSLTMTGCPAEKSEQAADAPAASPAASTPQSQAQATSVPAGRTQQLSLDLPEGWTALPRKQGETASRIVAPDKRRMLVVERLVTRVNGGMTEAYARQRLTDYTRQDGAVQWVEPLKPLSKNGLSWYTARYDVTKQDQRIIAAWAITENEGIPYIFSYADMRGKRNSEFDLLLAGISFK